MDTTFRDIRFNVKQASEIFNISRGSLYHLEKEKKISPSRVEVGATTKRFFTWDDLSQVARHYSDKIKKPSKKIKVFSNLKGGVGKSTIACQFAMRASSQGLKTLLIDLDPQGHSSLAFRVYDEKGPTILDCLLKNAKQEERVNIKERIVQLTPFLGIVPSNITLSTGEIKLVADNKRAERLKMILESIESELDLIILDTGPSAGLLNINAFLASDQIVIVTETDFYSVAGLVTFFTIISDLNDDFGFDPAITIVPNRFDIRENSSQEALGALRANYSDCLTNTVIRKNADLKEAHKLGLPVWTYKNKSTGSEDIRSFTDEILRS